MDAAYEILIWEPDVAFFKEIFVLQGFKNLFVHLNWNASCQMKVGR